jgi:hypothetical protein
MRDLESRLASKVQITTDGFRPYVNAVEATFAANVDYAMLVKVYGGDESNRERYSPSEIVDAVPTVITGRPKPYRISTFPCRTTKPHGSDAAPQIHAANECLLQKAR